MARKPENPFDLPARIAIYRLRRIARAASLAEARQLAEESLAIVKEEYEIAEIEEANLARHGVVKRAAPGARKRASNLVLQGARTRAAVKDLEHRLRAAGTPERELTKRIAAALNLSIDTVRGHRK